MPSWDYPLHVNVLSVLSTVVSWGAGTILFYLISPWLAAGYLLLCMAVVILSLKFRCSYCCYYGKRCATGLGLMSPLFFRKGDPSGFSDKRNILTVALPSFGALLLPLAGGVLGSIVSFSWVLMIVAVIYFLVAIPPGFALQKNVYCKRCAQGKLGCPSYRMMQGGKLE
ncbi:MAG TPA: hypothetical protein VK436_14060 [Methanocella sp.]|nr:hypothetical protein [Methanocella sp.]